MEIVGIKDTAEDGRQRGLEMFRKLLDDARAGDNVGVLLRGIEKSQIERGQVICAPGSIKPHKKFKAKLYVLTKDEGMGATRRSSRATARSSTSARPT